MKLYEGYPYWINTYERKSNYGNNNLEDNTDI